MYVNPTQESPASTLPRLTDVFAALRSETLQARDMIASPLEKRQFGIGYGGYYDNEDSGWYRYGRWILLGVIVGIAVLIWLVVCGCNRRRTRYGQQPVKYTGWATPGYQHPQQQGIAPVQPYTAPQTYPMQEYNAPTNAQSYQQNYAAAGYQPNQGYGQSEYTAPPVYPATNEPTYPSNVASREK